MKNYYFLLVAFLFIGCSNDDMKTDLSAPTNVTRSSTNAESYYYWCDGVKIPLSINEDKQFILTETSNYEQISQAIVNSGGKIENSSTRDSYASLGIESSSANNVMSETNLTSFTVDDADLSTIDTVDLVYTAPYFKTDDGADMGITNVFDVRLEEEQDLVKLKRLSETYHFIMLGRNQFDRSIYTLACTKDTYGNALEMANLLYESGAFKYATPEFIVEVHAAATNDPYFSSQWGLYNGAYPDCDINYNEAMAVLSFPNIGNIIVAVVDNGVYANHPDLPLYNISYDTYTGKSPSQMYGDHGTLCAGVIGATANNGIGIAGVASGVKIMPISIVYSDDARRLGITASTVKQLANAIRVAADKGADVISNSWSISNTSSPISDINEAIKYAQSSGRGGKGCVVVFASGNDAGAVAQPAAGVPATIVVGAIENTGGRASYSNYGSALDVVAPGSNIWSTTWTGGYGIASGTSLSCPFVAGVAALMLSVNPDLTTVDVQNIIEGSAQKLDGYTFSMPFFPPIYNISTNNEVGSGLVDAYGALDLILSEQFPISGPDHTNVNGMLEGSTYETYRIPAVLPAGVSFAGWTITGGRYKTDGQMTDAMIHLTFQDVARYTLAAKFRLQNGGTYNATKTIDVYDRAPHLTLYTGGQPIELDKTYHATVSYYNPSVSIDPQFKFGAVNSTFSSHAGKITVIDNFHFDVVFSWPGEYTLSANIGNATALMPISVQSQSISIRPWFYATISTTDHTGARGFQAVYYTKALPHPTFKFTMVRTPDTLVAMYPDSLHYPVQVIGVPSEIEIDDQPVSKISRICCSLKEKNTAENENVIWYWFYVRGNYTVRAEIEGRPDIYTDYPFTVTEIANGFQPINPD